MAIEDEVAAVVHEAWSHWMRYLLSRGKPVVGGVLLLQGDVDKWRGQVETDYGDLSEEEKASDKEWAGRILEEIRGWLV